MFKRMTKILDISTDQQTPNRLFYDGTGNVKQVVDAAQNIPFTQPDLAKRPVLNITEGAFEFDGVNDELDYKNSFGLPNTGFSVFVKIQPLSTGTIILFGCDSTAGTRGWFVGLSNGNITLFDGIKFDTLGAIPLSQTEYNYVVFSVRSDGVVRYHCFNNSLTDAYIREKTGYNINGFTANQYNLKIGAIDNGFNFSGSIAYISVYEGILQELFNAIPASTRITNTILPQDFPYFKRYKDTPEVTNNLVTNGNFDTNVDGWLGGDVDTVVAWDNGTLKATFNGAARFVFQEFDVVPFQKYTARVYFAIGANVTNRYIQMRDGGVSGTFLGNSAFINTDGISEIEFTPTQTKVAIKLACQAAITPAIFNVDNVSVIGEISDPKKLFVSSRYLEGANIDRNGEITSINDEFGFDYQSLNADLILRKSNFENISRKGGLTSSLITLDIGVQDYYFGAWVKCADNTGVNVLYATFSGSTINGLIGFNGTYQFQLSNGDTTAIITDTGVPISTTEWEYVVFSRKNGISYLYLNGILRFTTNNYNGFDLNSDTRIYIMKASNVSQGFIGLWDDVLFSIGDSIINPTGYAIGDKVFQPPARRSLEVLPPFNNDLPIIDISSTNVNKDASNKVQTAYNKYNKAYSSFRQTEIAKQPIEQGDGFEFSASNLESLKIENLEGLRNDFTFEFWVLGQTLNNKAIFSFGVSGSFKFLHVISGSSDSVFLSSNGSSFDIADNVPIGSNIITGTWQHVAYENYNGQMYRFLNGVYDGIDIDTSLGLYPFNSEIKVGTNWNSAAGMHGKLEDVRIYDFAKYKKLNFTPPKRSSE